jgi:hypothetical protein
MRNFIEILSQASMASEVDSTDEVKGALNFCGRTAKSACSVGKFARNPPKFLRERSKKKASRREENISALSINKKDITQEIMTSLVSNTSEVEKPVVNKVLKSVVDEQEQPAGVKGSSAVAAEPVPQEETLVEIFHEMSKTVLEDVQREKNLQNEKYQAVPEVKVSDLYS